MVVEGGRKQERGKKKRFRARNEKRDTSSSTPFREEQMEGCGGVGGRTVEDFSSSGITISLIGEK